jgi:hypothetical protein
MGEVSRRNRTYIEVGECKLVSRNSNQFKSFVSLI